jgi:glycosyltransferase involved in cell wall biosynthesis
MATSSPMPPRDKSRPSVTLVLPAYNEAARIPSALDELFGYLRRHGPPREGGRSSSELGPIDVLVVDDGSTDGTSQIVVARPEAAGAGAQLRVLRRAHGGKGAAVKAGMLAAEGDYVIFADADLATPPDQLPLLTEALAAHDIALGSRVQPDGSDRRRSQPLHRRLVGRVFHALARAWVTGPVPDTQCGFKGFRRGVARDLFARQHLNSIVFDAEVIHLARRRGYSIAIVPVQWSDKRGSRMHLGARLTMRVHDRRCLRGVPGRVLRYPARLLGPAAGPDVHTYAVLALDLSSGVVGRLRRHRARAVPRLSAGR